MPPSQQIDIAAWSAGARIQSLQASDGYRLQYRVWRPQGAARGTFVAFNGIMSNSRWFGPLAADLCSAGFELVGADRRGSGLNVPGWGDAPSAGQLVEDAVAIAGAHRREGLPLVVLGWCWGAALAVAVTAKLKDEASGLVLVTPGMFTTAALRAGLEAQRDRIERAAPEECVVDSPIDEAWFTDGPALDAFIRKDEHRVRQITPRLVDISAKLATAAVARVRRLQVPILVLLAAHDEATDNAATREALDAMDLSTLEIRELPARHGMQFDAPQEVTAALLSFARQRESAP